MEPRIQYAQTKDGVSIAYWKMGEGHPLVEMPGLPWSHIGLELQFPEYLRWHQRLAANRTLVRYDGRGSGLSDRTATDYSLDARLLELEAVADHLRLETFALLGPANAAPVAVAYADRHPDRVSQLLLWNATARVADIAEAPEVRTLLGLIGQDWELFTETIAHAIHGWSTDDAVRRLAAYFRECMTPEAAEAAFSAIMEFDVSNLLPRLSVPTLVLHRRHVRFLPVTGGRHLASQIPGAQLIILEGNEAGWFLGDTGPVLRAIDEFLDKGDEATARAELPEGMAAILFADIANSTALTEQLGDAAFRSKARELDTSLRATIRESGGTPVEGKVLGDGVLAVFTFARQAIDCALRCNANSEPLELQLHLGIHAGDVIREGNNVYGGAVNIAARIAGASAPGEVLVSDTVRSLARTSAGVAFDDRGERELKGVADPQRLFAVRGGGE